MDTSSALALATGVFLVGMGVILGSQPSGDYLAIISLALGAGLVGFSAYKPARTNAVSDEDEVRGES